MDSFPRPWSDIDALGKLKISKNSYIFVIVVPILSQIFQQLPFPIVFRIGENEFNLDLAFPITWYTLYAGALFIAIGTVIYSLWCPPMIRLYPNYGAFLTAGRDDYFLEKSAERFLSDDVAEEALSNLKSEKPVLYNVTTEKMDGVGNHILESSSIDRANPAYVIARRRTFNDIFDKINLVSVWTRGFATLFYYLGIAAFIGIIIYNACLVATSFLP
jgi:hypothetical protein